MGVITSTFQFAQSTPGWWRVRPAEVLHQLSQVVSKEWSWDSSPPGSFWCFCTFKGALESLAHGWFSDTFDSSLEWNKANMPRSKVCQFPFLTPSPSGTWDDSFIIIDVSCPSKSRNYMTYCTGELWRSEGIMSAEVPIRVPIAKVPAEWKLRPMVTLEFTPCNKLCW